MMNHFKEKNGNFDYEEFYDYMKDDAIHDDDARDIAKPFTSQYRDFDQLVYSFEKIYTQLVEFYLKDKKRKTSYENSAFSSDGIDKYHGFCHLIEYLSKKYRINVHTLNHDLWFERFNRSACLGGELCDGFEEIGSPYYGRLKYNNVGYMVRLERYTGIYCKKHRLFKLHGSRNYGVYNTTKNSVSIPENYFKTRDHIGFTDIYKEKEIRKGVLEYERDFTKYHSEVLTGTTSKIERYKDPLLYKILFQHFKENLKEAEMLLIIGYGGKDSEINNILLENFDYNKKKSFMIDPYAGPKVQNLGKRLKSKLIPKELDYIQNDDLEI